MSDSIWYELQYELETKDLLIKKMIKSSELLRQLRGFFYGLLFVFGVLMVIFILICLFLLSKHEFGFLISFFEEYDTIFCIFLFLYMVSFVLLFPCLDNILESLVLGKSFKFQNKLDNIDLCILDIIKYITTEDVCETPALAAETLTKVQRQMYQLNEYTKINLKYISENEKLFHESSELLRLIND
jgi:hypothetical protein